MLISTFDTEQGSALFSHECIFYKTSGDNVSANNNSSSLSTSPSPSPSTSTSAPLSDTNIIPHVQKGKKCKGSSHTGSSESGSSSDSKSVSEECTITTSKTTRQYTTPAQDTLKKETDILEKILLVKIESRGAGLAKTGAQKEIEELRKIIEQKKKLLSRKINAAKCQKRYRDETQKTMFDIKAGKLDLASSLRINEEPGRPRIEVHQPELLKTIADIAMFGGAAYDRRRSNLVRSCKILKELTAELQSTLCITISKSATYLRLLLRDSHTVEGKRHVSTVPVKLCRAQNNAKKHQIDGKFCTASIRFLEQLISVLGSKQVAVISQDDKSKVLIGLAAANRQAHLLIHLEYKITLPDHDWVVAPRHKLTPSVYAGIKIEDGKIGHPKNLSYSGPTYVAIRSAKRSSSTALAHAYDFEKLFILVSFKEILYDGEKVKPIVITSDGGSDENPHYKKAITSACHHFQLYNLDAIFIITNAPGRSAYNRVERRMANFSNELAALVLPHDHYGSHLDSAGQTLAEIWGEMVIGGYSVIAEYVNADGFIEINPAEVSAEWYNLHVKESQYFLQIVQCDDIDCCGEWRSNLKNILPMSNGFLPPPFPLRRSSDGQLVIPTPEEVEEDDSFLDPFVRQAIGLKPVTITGFPVPYDMHCPSLSNEFTGRICDLCVTYFAPKKQKSVHTTAIHGRKSL